MSGFPIANFSDSDQGLFSPEEILQLMRIEFERARRYRYPITLMLAEVDRLEYIHDLYGYESKEEILHAVVSLLRSITRASDFLGCMMDDRLMAVFPHTPERAASALAGRFLRGIRKLEFRSDGRLLRASLSIGIAVSQDEGEQDFDEFAQASENALRYAIDSGGDRFVQRAAATAVIDELRRDLEKESELLARSREVARERQATPEAAPAPPDPRPLSPAASPMEAEDELPSTVPAGASAELSKALEEIPDGALKEQIHALFSTLGTEASEVRGLELEVLAIAHQAVQMAQRDARAQTVSAQEGHVDLLERRVSKLKELLDNTEAELQRIASMKGVDAGVASIYRSVQGLLGDEQDYARKKEMLSLIFDANVELRKKIDSKS